MTRERHQQIQELVTKLKECLKTCDEIYDDEGEQMENLRGRIAAAECKHNLRKLYDAVYYINEAIEELGRIEE